MNSGTNAQRSLWPHAIICWFALFIAAMVVWLVYASRQRMDLVSSDYYAQEVLYQNRIDAAVRANGKAEVAYDVAKQLITIQIAGAQKISGGEIHFYRPNNAKLDHNVKLALNAGSQLPVRKQKLIPISVVILAVLLVMRGMSLGIPYLSPDLSHARLNGGCH